VLDWLDNRARELDEADVRAMVDALSPAASAIPEVAADEDLLTETDAAAAELTRLLIGSALPAVEPLPRDAAPAVLVSIVRVWARRGIDLRGLMRGYRRAQGAFWRYWMADVAARIEDPALRMAVLEHSWDRISAWYDAQMDQVEAIYGEERDRWLRGAQARRAGLIRTLLAGENVDHQEAERTLGYDLRPVHTALVLWADAEDPDALTRLEEAARDLARAADGARAVTLPAGSAALWAWIAADGEAAAPAWRALALPDGVRVAAGRPARGAEGFRSSHQDAQLVRRLMPFAGRPEPLVGFADVALACLMSSEPEAMRRVVADELGALGRRDPNIERLRETARVYLECGANAREAAERLNMHKNTVHYRLARVEELRGRPVEDRRLEFEVALMLAHLLGDRVLPADQPASGRP
jgi:DNA-binding PucR family transcriptional regulator